MVQTYGLTHINLAVILALAFLAQPARGKICNISDFLEQCPTLDPAYAKIRADFVIRRDGVVVGEVTCRGPISQIPIAQYTDELIVLQSLRTIYYMDAHMPWTGGSLYDWMKEKVGGINIRTTAGGQDEMVGNAFGDGRTYFNVRAKDDYNRNWQRSFVGIAELIGLMMHERRHADDDGHPHVGCCPSGADGCDQQYDETNLSPYGIQWWFRQQIIEGRIYTGYGCLSTAEVNTIRDALRTENNRERDRFCQNPPPLLTDANNPVSGCDKRCSWPRIAILVWRWLPIWVPVIVVAAVIGWLLFRAGDSSLQEHNQL
jgi:hypothetical protein